ncbi:MAG TPA: VOC family protein [Candidatus Baltobacteraceae bacterium]|nr:VOC family protein [Candidatus Baltobacteraceae bacterium]
MVTDFAFVAYPAKDVAALRAFYADALGFEFGRPFEENGVEKYAEAKVGSGWFAVMTEEWAGSARGGGMVAFEVPDIEKAFAELRSKNVRTERIHDTGVCKLGSFHDPEGNQVTLHQITVPH